MPLDAPLDVTDARRASGGALVVVSCFHRVPGLVQYGQACRALPCPRKGLSPPDSFVAIDCQRTFFRFATRTPSHAANSRGKWACRWGRIELVRLYLERGVDALEADAERWPTPLAWATKRGHHEIIELLRSAGAGA